MTKQGNYRVIVLPDEPCDSVTEERWKVRCKQIVADIQRHVDSFTRVYWESDTLCVFCGSIWEVQTYDTNDIPRGQPLCCYKAVKEWEKSKGGNDG